MLHPLPATPITDPPLETENDLLTIELKVKKYGVLYRRDALALLEMIRAQARDIGEQADKIAGLEHELRMAI